MNQNNQIIKTCKNCAYRTKDCLGLDFCLKTGHLCSTVRSLARFSIGCDTNFSGWVAIPPRRSFRQWFYDTFWKLN